MEASISTKDSGTIYIYSVIGPTPIDVEMDATSNDDVAILDKARLAEGTHTWEVIQKIETKVVFSFTYKFHYLLV